MLRRAAEQLGFRRAPQHEGLHRDVLAERQLDPAGETQAPARLPAQL